MFLLILAACSKRYRNCRGKGPFDTRGKGPYDTEVSGRSSLGQYSIGQPKECCDDLRCRPKPGFWTNCKICRAFSKNCDHLCTVYVCMDP